MKSQIGDDTSVFAGVHRLRPSVLGLALLAAPMRMSRGLINGTMIANLVLIAVVIVLCLSVW